MKHLIVLALLLGSGVATAASFNCKKAATLVEKEICANPTLGRLDDALKKNYDGALATNIGEEARREIKSSQRLWLKKRDSCKTAACIEAMYRQRIDALCDYPAISGVNWGCVVSSDEIH